MRVRSPATPICVNPSTPRLFGRICRRSYNNSLSTRTSENTITIVLPLPEPQKIQNPFNSQVVRNARLHRAEFVAASLTQLDQPLLYVPLWNAMLEYCPLPFVLLWDATKYRLLFIRLFIRSFIRSAKNVSF